MGEAEPNAEEEETTRVEGLLSLRDSRPAARRPHAIIKAGGWGWGRKGTFKKKSSGKI